MNRKYNWQRYWYEMGNTPPIDSYGYLNKFAIHEGGGGEIVTLDSILHKGCLILLGEPGIGKSDTLQRAYKSEHCRLTNTDDDVRFIDLRTVASRDDIKEELFDQRFFKQWLEGSHTLHLFMDSFDESLMQYENLIDYFGKQFEALYPFVHRLKLRIACRTGIWIGDLGERLKLLWTEEQFSTFHLAPLCKQDIVDVLLCNSIDPDLFIEEAESKGVVSFLVKPVTLLFVLEGYARLENKLPESQIEIYDQGCRIYCNEVNPSRKRKKSILGKCNEAKKFTIASQLAVLTLLSNRSSITIEPILGSKTTSELNVHEIKAAFPSIEIDELEETLQTGLFTSIGTERFRWAHLTFAEYLAASYLNSHMSIKQISDLIFHTEYTGKLIPQLHQTAAWIAGMNIQIFDAILKKDYDVLFLSDFSNIQSYQKRSFIKKFLEDEKYQFRQSSYCDYRKYSSLKYPGIEDQIRHFITDYNNHPRVITLALEVANQCKLTGLQEDYLNLIRFCFDEVQTKAIYTFIKNANREEYCELKKIVLTCRFYDAHVNSLVISKLMENGMLNTREVLQLLSRVDFKLENNFIKQIIQKTIGDLDIDQLAEVLEWVSFQNSTNNRRKDKKSLSLISDLLLLFVAQKLDNQKIHKRWREILAIRFFYNGKGMSFKETISIFQEEENDYLRRLMLKEIIGKVKIVNVLELNEMKNAIIYERDRDWLQECSQSSRFKEKARFQWILRSINNEKNRHVNPKILWEHHAEMLKPLVLSLNVESPDFMEKMIGVVKIKPTVYWKLLDGIRRIYNYLCEDSIVREALIKASESYLLLKSINKDDCFNDSYKEEIEAGRTAFSILYENCRSRLEALPRSVWEKWMPIIIFPKLHAWGYDDIEVGVKKYAQSQFSSMAIEAFIYRVDREEYLGHFPSNFCYHFWNEELASAMFEWVKLNFSKSSKVEKLLTVLFEKHYKPAIQYAESLLELPLPVENDSRCNCIIVARRLMTNVKDISWNTIWRCFENDIQFGNEVMYSFAESCRDNLYIGNFISSDSLSPRQLGEFFVWLNNNFQLPKDDLIYSPFTVEEWKTSILNRLVDMNTEQSFIEIRSIANRFPNLEKPIRTWKHIHKKYLRMTWKPYQPKLIGAMLQNSKKRFVGNVEQLMDLVIDSLQRLEARLQGVTPVARILWDKQEDGRFKHVDENVFSDWINQHLYDDLLGQGIVANREVEIRRGYGQGKGQRTDILISAVTEPDTYGEHDVVSIIVEVKGCWHSEVDNAMEKQLIEQYLKDNHLCTSGLYVVGWFYCPQWRTSEENFESARARFNEQAKMLSDKYKTKVRAFVLNAALR